MKFFLPFWKNLFPPNPLYRALYYQNSFFYILGWKKSQLHGILFSAVDGRFPVHGEVMPMTTYEKLALVLAFLQLLAALLALLK